MATKIDQNSKKPITVNSIIPYPSSLFSVEKSEL